MWFEICHLGLIRLPRRSGFWRSIYGQLFVIKATGRPSYQKQAPAADRKNRTKLIKSQKISMMPFLPKTNYLRKPGRSHQACYTLENNRNATSPEDKAPAATGRTSLILLNVSANQRNTYFVQKGGCGSLEERTKPIGCHKLSGRPLLPTRRSLQQL